MAVVQSTYPNFHAAKVDGQVADTTTADIDSYRLTGATSVPFGRAVSRSNQAGAGDRDCELYEGARYAGIAVMDERLAAGANGTYKQGDSLSAMWRGDVAVKVSAAVAPGDDVVIATAASGTGATAEEIGQLSSKAADGTHIALTGARFLTTTAAQDIAVVRLAGPAPV